MEWTDWQELLISVGFELDPASGPWRNDWLVANRFSVGAELREVASGEQIDWPDTHVLTVARRPH